jgi:hypothetical protein
MCTRTHVWKMAKGRTCIMRAHLCSKICMCTGTFLFVLGSLHATDTPVHTYGSVERQRAGGMKAMCTNPVMCARIHLVPHTLHSCRFSLQTMIQWAAFWAWRARVHAQLRMHRVGAYVFGRQVLVPCFCCSRVRAVLMLPYLIDSLGYDVHIFVGAPGSAAQFVASACQPLACCCVCVRMLFLSTQTFVQATCFEHVYDHALYAPLNIRIRACVQVYACDVCIYVPIYVQTYIHTYIHT